MPPRRFARARARTVPRSVPVLPALDPSLVCVGPAGARPVGLRPLGLEATRAPVLVLPPLVAQALQRAGRRGRSRAAALPAVARPRPAAPTLEGVAAAPVHLCVPLSPSLNRYYRSVVQYVRGEPMARVLISPEGRRYQRAVSASLRASLGPAWARLEGPLRAVLTLYVRVRGSDADNRAKAALDALQAAGVFENDKQLCEVVLRRFYDRTRPRIEILLEPVTDPLQLDAWRPGATAGVPTQSLPAGPPAAPGLTIPLAPSFNRYYRSVVQRVGGKPQVRVLLSREGRTYQEGVTRAVLGPAPAPGVTAAPGAPRQDALRLRLDLYVCVRGSDADNRAKAALDALQKAGLFANDKQLCEVVLRRFYDRARPRIEVHLDPVTDPAMLDAWRPPGRPRPRTRGTAPGR